MSTGRISKSLVVAFLLAPTTLVVAQPQAHYRYNAQLPPGEIGRSQLEVRPELHGYSQPVQINVPEGAVISVAEEGGFHHNDQGRALVGLHVGHVYRMRVSEIPEQGLAAVYPTIELIDRLHPPAGKETRFPIPIDIAEVDIALALSGKFVTRVIYVEDPNNALPARDLPEQRYLESLPQEDPLVLAGLLGRPVAILRMGSLAPDVHGPDEMFLFGCPPLVRFPTPLQVNYVPSELNVQEAPLEPPTKQELLPDRPELPEPSNETSDGVEPGADGDGVFQPDAEPDSPDGADEPTLEPFEDIEVEAEPEPQPEPIDLFDLGNPFEDEG